MKKTRAQKGITLVALIITIIVLLILAAVTIRAVTGDGILKYAQNSAVDYNKAQEDEEGTLQGYVETIDKELREYIPDSFEEDISPYIGYYADINADGTVDGIIFADLSKAGSGQWYDSYDDYSYDDYSWETETNLKKYYISQDTYQAKDKNGNDLAFQEKPVLATDGTGGQNDRFYVIALKNFTVTNGSTITSGFSWYSSKYGSLDSTRTSLAMGMTTYNDKRMSYGEANTLKMIEDWNADKSESKVSTDVWGVIQDEVSKGWFVPSLAEWVAFAKTFNISKTGEDTNCYKNFGLLGYYWSSSIYDTYNSCYIDFGREDATSGNASSGRYVRLCTTY